MPDRASGPDTAPEEDLEKRVGATTQTKDYALSKASKESATKDQHPEQKDATSDMHVFVLTVPSQANRLEKFLQTTTTKGYVGTQAITQIQGTESEHFYPSDSAIKDMHLSQDVLLAKKQNAMHQMLQLFAAECANAGVPLREFFQEAAIRSLTPKQVATYIGHMRFWLQASKLPPKSWAVMLEDDADVLGGPMAMRNMLQQAEDAAEKVTGAPAHFVYLRQCTKGKHFMETFLRDAAGYAIQPAMAKALLSQVRGDSPVNVAMKAFTEGGLCAPILGEKPTVKKESAGDLAQQHLEAAETPMNMFVLTVPRNHDRMVTFQKELDTLGFKGSDSVKKVDGSDFNNYYPKKDEMKKLKWTEKDQEVQKSKAVQSLLNEYKEGTLPKAFVSDAKLHLSPAQLATFLGHRRIWAQAASLPSNSWAVVLEDDAAPVAGPDALHAILKSAEVASMQQAHIHAQIVYLKPCATGKSFMQYFMHDAMGYAIRPAVAKALLEEAPGSVPVASAIKAITKGGVCAPFIK